MTQKRTSRRIFPERKQITIRVTPAEHKRIRMYVAGRGTTVTDLFLRWWEEEQRKPASTPAQATVRSKPDRRLVQKFASMKLRTP